MTTKNENEIDRTTNLVRNSILIIIPSLTKQVEKIYRNIIDNMKDEKKRIIQIQNVILHYSTIEEQLNNKSDNESSIDLGECEKRLREQEGLNESEQFLMIKLDIKNSSTNATFVQYEIFNPHNYSRVSLEICRNISIKIEVPVILEESTISLISSLEDSGYDIFDIRDEFYNDICTIYTAQNGADMVFSLRKNLIYDSVKEMYLCQEGCEFESFDVNASKAECSCQIQETTTVTNISKISFDKSEFFDSFYKTLYNSNFRVLKCIKFLFTLKGIKRNY